MSSQKRGGIENNKGNRTHNSRLERTISEKADEEILRFLRDHQLEDFHQFCNENPSLFGKSTGSPTSRSLRKKVQQRYYNLKRKDSKYLPRKVSIRKCIDISVYLMITHLSLILSLSFKIYFNKEALIDQFNNVTIEPPTTVLSTASIDPNQIKGHCIMSFRQLDIDKIFHPEFNYKTIVTARNMDRGRSMVTLKIVVPCFDINDMPLIKISLKQSSNFDMDSLEIQEPAMPGILWRNAKERNEDTIATQKLGEYVPKDEGIYEAESKLENEMYANPEMQIKKTVFQLSSKIHLTALSNSHFNPIATSKNCDVTLDPVPDNVAQVFYERDADGSEIETIQYCANMTFTMVLQETIAQIDVVVDKDTHIGLKGTKVIRARRRKN